MTDHDPHEVGAGHFPRNSLFRMIAEILDAPNVIVLALPRAWYRGCFFCSKSYGQHEDECPWERMRRREDPFADETLPNRYVRMWTDHGPVLAYVLPGLDFGQ